MKTQLFIGLLAGLAAQSAFAYTTRPMSVVRGTDDSGHMTATCTFAEDTTGLVEKYNLYVVWAEVDAGRQLAAWPNKQKVAEVTPEDSQVVVRFPDAALDASFVRVILGEPTYSTEPREDGIALLDYVESVYDTNKKTGSWLMTDYTPGGTASLDMEFSMSGGPGNGKYTTVFSARNAKNAADNATYSAFIHQTLEKGGYKWRLDYGKTAGTETEGAFGFQTDGRRCHLRTTATGESVDMTLRHGTGVTQATTTTGSLSKAGSALLLFACKDGNDKCGNFGTYKCYGFRATEGTLKVNLLPARQTVGGVVSYGLYDTVAKKFFSSGDTSNKLKSDDSVTNSTAICDSSEVFAAGNDRGAERSMRIVPYRPEGKDFVSSVLISVPATNTKIPYSLEAVYPADGKVLPIAEVGDSATNVTFALPSHRNREDRKTLQFRLAPKLPAGYELLPYAIKPTSSNPGGAYIETDYKADGATTVSAKLSFLKSDTSLGDGPAQRPGTIFCSRSTDKYGEGNPGQAAFLTYNKDTEKFYWRYDYDCALGSNNTQGQLNFVYTLTIGTPGGLQVSSEDSSYVVDGAREAAEFEAEGEMMLFASYSGVTDVGGRHAFTGIGNGRGMHVYWLTVKDGTGDVMTLVPVKCTAEGEDEGKVGFWDFKNERFLKSSIADYEFSAPEGDADQSLARWSDVYLAPERLGLALFIR